MFTTPQSVPFHFAQRRHLQGRLCALPTGVARTQHVSHAGFSRYPYSYRVLFYLSCSTARLNVTLKSLAEVHLVENGFKQCLAISSRGNYSTHCVYKDCLSPPQQNIIQCITLYGLWTGYYKYMYLRCNVIISGLSKT